MRHYLIAANWKMNGRKAQIATLIQEIRSANPVTASTSVVICPPAPYLAQVEQLLEGSAIAVGGQNLHTQESGAYTGEVSGAMLQDLGCRYVIVGHSERRALFGETDSLVAEKVSAALQNSLVPILCVGETAAQREAGQVGTVLAEQLDAVIASCGIKAFAGMVVAYEPVWAIGTGVTASPEQAQDAHWFIREHLKQGGLGQADEMVLLYGGSVNASNAQALFAQPDINGALIGGASLKAAEFLAICQAAHS